jgi:hypothetical protein
MGAVVLAVAGFMVMAAAIGPADGSQSSDSDELQGGAAIVGIAGGALVVAGLAIHTSEELGSGQAQTELDALQAERDRIKAERDRNKAAVRGQAWTITKQAAESARAGNCAVAVAKDGEVHDLDAEFHTTVFMRDAAIKKCLDETRLVAWRAYYAKHEHAAALTREAFAKAAGGDCAAVIELGRELRSIDLEFHDAVFVRNAGIRVCLDASAGSGATRQERQ